jgi:hypothetical protein
MKLRLAWIPLIAAACLALPSPAADKPPVESAWTATPIQIDGQLDEWPEAALQYNKDFEVRYAFKNDANFLYCVFVFDNPRYLSSLEQSGLTFWINPEKERRTYGFRFYRKMATSDQVIEQLEKNGSVISDQKKAEIKLKPRYFLYSCDVLNKKGDIIPHQPGTANGSYRVGRAQKRMVFEYAIPLALLTDPNQKPALDPTKPFHLGFEWGGLTEEMKKQSLAETGDANVQVDNSAAGMTASGSFSGERAEGQEAGGRSVSIEDGIRRRMPKKYDFWIDLKLGPKK